MARPRRGRRRRLPRGFDQGTGDVWSGFLKAYSAYAQRKKQTEDGKADFTQPTGRQRHQDQGADGGSGWGLELNGVEISKKGVHTGAISRLWERTTRWAR